MFTVSPGQTEDKHLKNYPLTHYLKLKKYETNIVQSWEEGMDSQKLNNSL